MWQLLLQLPGGRIAAQADEPQQRVSLLAVGRESSYPTVTVCVPMATRPVARSVTRTLIVRTPMLP
jgi:hypothetical protein